MYVLKYSKINDAYNLTAECYAGDNVYYGSFVIDTGVADTYLRHEAFDALDCRVDTSRITNGLGYMNNRKFTQVFLSRLQIEDITLEDIEVFVTTEPGMNENLLGLSVLHKLDIALYGSKKEMRIRKTAMIGTDRITKANIADALKSYKQESDCMLSEDRLLSRLPAHIDCTYAELKQLLDNVLSSRRL